MITTFRPNSHTDAQDVATGNCRQNTSRSAYYFWEQSYVIKLLCSFQELCRSYFFNPV